MRAEPRRAGVRQCGAGQSSVPAKVPVQGGPFPGIRQEDTRGVRDSSETNARPFRRERKNDAHGENEGASTALRPKSTHSWADVIRVKVTVISPTSFEESCRRLMDGASSVKGDQRISRCASATLIEPGVKERHVYRLETNATLQGVRSTDRRVRCCRDPTCPRSPRQHTGGMQRYQDQLQGPAIPAELAIEPSLEDRCARAVEDPTIFNGHSNSETMSIRTTLARA